MRFAFVGGTGFIGRAAALAALSRGHAVTLLHRGVTPAQLPFAVDVLVDRRDPSALAQALARARPDVVVDTRAMTRADAETTALAVRIVGAPLVVLSSMDVYAQFGRLNGLPGPAPEPLVTEDSPLTIPRPFESLGGHEGGPDYDKKDVEAVVRALASEANIPTTALRLPGVFGSGDPKRRFWAWVRELDRGVETFACAPGHSLRLTHVHVENAAHAIVLASERGHGGHRVFNVGEARTPTMRERLASIGAAVGRSVRLADDGSATGLLGSFPNDCVLDTSRLRDALGIREVVGVEDAIADLVRAARKSAP